MAATAHHKPQLLITSPSCSSPAPNAHHRAPTAHPKPQLLIISPNCSSQGAHCSSQGPNCSSQAPCTAPLNGEHTGRMQRLRHHIALTVSFISLLINVQLPNCSPIIMAKILTVLEFRTRKPSRKGCHTGPPGYTGWQNRFLGINI
jgi:hypothetical protein